MESNYENDLSNDSNIEQKNCVNFPDIELSNESKDTFNDISINYNNNNNNYNMKSDFNTKDVIIYETNTSDESFDCDNSYDNSIDAFVVSDYENKFKILSAENTKLSQQLIDFEEQIMDLITDKKCLEKSTKIKIDSFKQKIDFYVSTNEELKQNILNLESLNCELNEKLNQKTRDLGKLKTNFQEIEDKLLYTEFQLSESNRKESELRLSLTVANQTLKEEKRAKYEAIERLNELSINCIDRDKHIIELKSKMDSLIKEISDKDNELWFHRSGDRLPIGHDYNTNKKKKTTPDSSSVFVNRLKRSKSSDKSTKYSDSFAMNQMDSHFYEKISDIKTDGSNNQNNNNNNNVVNETSVPFEEEIKNLNSSQKSSFFPSLPDVILRKLQLLRESCCSLESLTEQEVESKFSTLSLSFKTDKLTLDQRVNLHKHQRDVAELDAKNELNSLRDYIQNLNQLLFSSDDLILTNMRSEIKELMHKIETQVEVIGQTNAKISSRSELFGAVKQEERVNSAFDLVLLHSENLKRAKEQERKELEKTKKLLNSDGQKKIDFESDSDNESVPLRRSIRSISTTIIPKMNLIRVRRASVSSIEILPNTDMTHRKSVQHNISAKYVTTSPSYLLNRSRRCSMPATPAMYRPRNGADSESSHLEITAEEKGGSESDASSVANQESDEEHNTHSRLHLRLSEEIDNSSNSSEQNNNTTNGFNNNEFIETISHRINSRENSDKSSDNSSDENNKNIENQLNKEENQRKTLINIIEYNYLINLISFCFEGRVGSYVKQIVQELRLVLAIILLISAVLIVLWSLIPLSFPCECRCTYSWDKFINILINDRSKISISPSH